MTSVPNAKNTVRRCLRGIVDPYPSRKRLSALWDYFGSRCAYCGKSLERTGRHGHRDHLLAFKNGGGSDLGNLVLACRECNGDEKRDGDWLTFLRLKNPERKAFAEKKRRIEKWMALNVAGRRMIPKRTRKAVEGAVAKAWSALDAAVAELRELKKP
jgi:hypothetical protein